MSSVEGRWAIPSPITPQKHTATFSSDLIFEFQLASFRSKSVHLQVVPCVVKDRSLLPCFLTFSFPELKKTWRTWFSSRDPPGQGPHATVDITALPPNTTLTICYTLLVRPLPICGLERRQGEAFTCYLNSVLQMLFHLPVFRQIILSVPNDPHLIILSGLKQLFENMSFAATVSTIPFTEALGWPPEARVVQHDAADFLHTLFDYLLENLPPPFGDQLRDLAVTNLRVKEAVRNLVTIDVAFPRTKLEEAIRASLAEEGAEIVRIAPILFIQVESQDYFSPSVLPASFDLEGVSYILHGVILLEGSTEGHFVAFIRPGELPVWIKFSDTDVRPVDLSSVTGVPSILMYVTHQSDFYRDFPPPPRTAAPPSAASPEPKPMQVVQIASDEDIRAACARGFPSVASIIPSCTIEVPSTACTREIYDAVAAALGLSSTGFNLRFSPANRQISSSIARRTESRNILQRTAASRFLYMDTEPASAGYRASDFPFILAHFDPAVSPSSTVFVRRIYCPRLKLVKGLFDLVREAVGLDVDDADLGIFANGVRIVATSRKEELDSLLIVQNLARNRELDPSAAEGFVSFYRIWERVVGHPVVTHEFPCFLEMSRAVDTEFVEFGSLRRFRMKVPLTVERLGEVVAEAAGLQLGEGEVVLLYEALRPMTPDVEPMANAVPKAGLERYAIFFRAGKPKVGLRARVSVSEDGIRAANVYEMDFDGEVNVGGVADRIGIERGRIGRVLKIVNSGIQRVVGVDEKVVPRAEFRIELVPMVERFRFVNWGAVFNNTLLIVAFDQPFLFEVGEGEEFESVKERLSASVKKWIGEEPFEIVLTNKGTRKVDQKFWGNQNFGLTICLNEVDADLFFNAEEFFRKRSVTFLNP